MVKLEKLEEKFVELKTTVFYRGRFADFMESIMFAWIIGTLFFYMNLFIEGNTGNMMVERNLNIIIFITAITIVGMYSYNRETAKYYKKIDRRKKNKQ